MSLRLSLRYKGSKESWCRDFSQSPPVHLSAARSLSKIMTTKTGNGYWRSRYARQLIKQYQADQLLSYTIRGPSLPTASSPETGRKPPSDRAPLHPIPAPAPILKGDQVSKKGDPPHVGIIGAGASGLYIAMILDSLNITYDIIEASDRVGGRIYTHHFEKSTNEWNYFVSVLGSIVFNDA